MSSIIDGDVFRKIDGIEGRVRAGGSDRAPLRIELVAPRLPVGEKLNAKKEGYNVTQCPGHEVNDGTVCVCAQLGGVKAK
jgi:regulator of RNase E activity RraB